MSWTTIGSFCGCVLIAAYLTFFQGWSGEVAILVVPLAVLALLSLLLGVAYSMCDHDERATFIAEFRRAMRRDLEALLKILTFRG